MVAMPCALGQPRVRGGERDRGQHDQQHQHPDGGDRRRRARRVHRRPEANGLPAGGNGAEHASTVAVGTRNPRRPPGGHRVDVPRPPPHASRPVAYPGVASRSMTVVTELDLPEIDYNMPGFGPDTYHELLGAGASAELAGALAAGLHRARRGVGRLLPAGTADDVPRAGDRRAVRHHQRSAARERREQHPEPDRRQAPAAAVADRARVHAEGGGPLAPGHARVPGPALDRSGTAATAGAEFVAAIARPYRPGPSPPSSAHRWATPACSSTGRAWCSGSSTSPPCQPRSRTSSERSSRPTST